VTEKYAPTTNRINGKGRFGVTNREIMLLLSIASCFSILALPAILGGWPTFPAPLLTHPYRGCPILRRSCKGWVPHRSSHHSHPVTSFAILNKQRSRSLTARLTKAHLRDSGWQVERDRFSHPDSASRKGFGSARRDWNNLASPRRLVLIKLHRLNTTPTQRPAFREPNVIAASNLRYSFVRPEESAPLLSRASAISSERMKTYWVYIISNKSRRLYVGFSSKLPYRIFQHKNKLYPDSFTAQYEFDTLV
jgi:hypothetical protein